MSNNDSEAGSREPVSSASLQLAIIPNHDAGPRTPTTSDVIEPVDEGVPADSQPFIFKVHNLLRDVNKKAYEPATISIGPYHWDKPHLQLMKAHKLRFQKLMLGRRNGEAALSRYLDAIRPDEEQARKSYAESTTHITSDEFVEMLVLDGIFIIELLWKFKKFKSERENCDFEIRNDPLFKMPWALNLLQRDLMLFENQLPFFILVKLFRMIQPDCEPGVGLDSLALSFFNDLFPGHGKTGESRDIKHLLDLIHMYWGSQKVSDVNGSCNMDKLEPMRCATKLKEVGIKLVKIEDGISFDIEFRNGELRIPVLTIEDTTEPLLRNLMAYEQYCGDSGFHTVTDYMAFFSFLIKTREDVERLTKPGVLKSFTDENVTACMFNTLGDCITGPSQNFQYAGLFKSVNDYCKTPWNRYMAILRRDYANSPWGILGIFTASALLSLAILEVTFQILSWKKQK